MLSRKNACLVLLLAFVPAAYATPSSDAAGTCLADNTSGKDRKQLARWIFLAMAQHPEIGDLSQSTPAALEQSNRETGALFTRLIADDCATEIKTMVQESGVGSISTAFEFLGKAAMQELMSHPQVNGAMSSLNQYVDEARIQAVVGQ
jgi:hypothetical protein